MPGNRRRQEVGAQVRGVEQDVVVAGRPQVRGDGGRDDVARGEVGQRVGAEHDPASVAVDQHGALAAHRLGDQRLLTRGVRARSTARWGGTAPSRRRRPRRRPAAPAPARRRWRRPGSRSRRTPGRSRRWRAPWPGRAGRPRRPATPSACDAGDPQADDAAVGGAQRVERDGVLEHLDAAGAQGAGERAGDLRAARVAAGVHDPVAAVPALAGQRRAAADVEVEAGAELLQRGDRRPAPRRPACARPPRRRGRRRRRGCPARAARRRRPHRGRRPARPGPTRCCRRRARPW